MSSESTAMDAFPCETVSDYASRMEAWLEAQQCTERESGGARCEKDASHSDKCACPEALEQWMRMRYGTKARIEVVFHA
jgi:hypothetical protein